jgi:O-antigen/teichoic acid export membrane protein
MWGRQRDLLGNTASLVATTGLTSGLGFAFWTLAARLYSQQTVGYSAAALSAMTLLGTMGVLGMGTLLIGELPRRTGARGGLIAAALLTSGLGSLILAVGFVVLAPRFTTHFADVSGSVGRAALFCVGVVLAALTMVFDQATIGLLRGGLQLSRNFTFAVVKLAALVGITLALHHVLGLGIVLAWISSNALSLIPVGLMLLRAGGFSIPWPDWQALRSLSKVVMAHNWLNLSIQVPVYLMTVIAASIVSPAANAGFYAAWTVANVLNALPLHFSTVLFAVASADPRAIARKLRFALALSVSLGIPGMLALGIGAHLVLSLFGPGYARVATLPMILLVATYLPTIPKVFYIAVCRALGRISRAATVLTTFAAFEVAAAIIGGLKGGLIGLSTGILVVAVLEALITAPLVARTAVHSGRHRRVSDAYSDSPATGSGDGWVTTIRRDGADPQGRWQIQHSDPQQAGLQLLLSMATTAPFMAVRVRSDSAGSVDGEQAG